MASNSSRVVTKTTSGMSSVEIVNNNNNVQLQFLVHFNFTFDNILLRLVVLIECMKLANSAEMKE